MAVRLTETAIAKATRETPEKGRRDLADAACPGLRMRFAASGGRTWVLACRDRLGRMRRFPLGSYPAMGIADAREAARTLHGQVKHQGADPVADRRRERAMGAAARQGIGTLKALLDLYAGPQGAAPKSFAQGRRRIDLVLKPELALPVATLTAGELQQVADRYPYPKAASFVIRTLRPALKWAAERGYVTAGLADLKQRMAPERRQRTLRRQELAALLPVLRKPGRPYAPALLFMLLTLARREEVAGMERRHLDLEAGTWTIPGDLTKNGEPHVVPLPRQALELLITLQMAKRKARKSGGGPDLVFHTTSGTRLANWDRETKLIMEASGTTGWTRHDLRRTGATMLGELGVIPDIVEAALNHVTIRNALAATYNRARYRPQVAEALQRLADELEQTAAKDVEVSTA